MLRTQGVVLRRIGKCGHFRSRDKDGGNTTVSENPCKLHGSIFYICKKTKFKMTVIGDVVAHLIPQKFTVLYCFITTVPVAFY